MHSREALPTAAHGHAVEHGKPALTVLFFAVCHSTNVERAVHPGDGAGLMMAGFMGAGAPAPLIDELTRQRKGDLTGIGIGRFITAKGRSKVVRECTLPLTSSRPVDLLVTELAVVSFPEGRATPMETAQGVTVEQVLAATDAELVVLPELTKTTGHKVGFMSSAGEST